jgi:hypothetical protein
MESRMYCPIFASWHPWEASAMKTKSKPLRVEDELDGSQIAYGIQPVHVKMHVSLFWGPVQPSMSTAIGSRSPREAVLEF